MSHQNFSVRAQQPSVSSSERAEQRLAKKAITNCPSTTQRTTFAIALSVAREPMFLLLIASVADLLNARRCSRGRGALSFSLFVIFGITIFQERKTERALEALRDLSSPRALVIRDGVERRIAGREVVRDDILILTEGDRVPADAAILSCNDLMVDESLLTGESVPVRKIAWNGVAEQRRDRAATICLLFIRAPCSCKAEAWRASPPPDGAPSSAKSARRLQSVETDETFLQKKSTRMIQTFAAVGLSLCALAVVLYGLTRGNWINGFLVGIALAMALAAGRDSRSS